MVPVRLRIEAHEARPGSHRIEIRVKAQDGRIEARERSTFVVR
jgi:hypothetical protein